MVFVMWHIRPKHEVVDVSTVYAGAPTWFSIKLHHGGKFTKLPDIKYIGGYPDPRNPEFADESPVIYYHFRIPNENDDQGAEVEGQVHADSPMKNVNHGNGEPIGEFMSLILFGSKNDSFSPEYRRGRVGSSNIGESSCSKRLNLDYIDEGVHISKEKNDDQDGSTDVQEAATCVHIDEMDGVREAATVVQEASTVDEGCYNTPLLIMLMNN
ncbi:unnamed protein product [Lactuca virosa]|uniref:Uncharacterized protein n=1 Tax=Lactuca virosa TaxID=75947 RepID=A0AAU9N7A6_9ASTR|nr:unnamed protein product [Lactuca virosa]